MKLSIVIPFHQYKHYLKECLHSLSDSSFHDFEVVLVKDHVQENIEDLVGKYQKKYALRVVELKDKHGVAAARNLGIKESTGEFVYFLDSDDYLLEDTLARLMTCERREVEVMYGHIHNTWNNKLNYLEKRNTKMEEMDEEEAVLSEQKKKARYEKYLENCQRLKIDSTEEKIEAIYHIFKKRKGFRNLTSLSNAYRRSFLEDKNVFFDETLVYYSDIVFIMEVLQKAKYFSGNEEAIYVKRKHNDPINYPALVQVEDDHRFAERMEAFKKARLKVEEESLLRYLLDRRIVFYYVERFSLRLRRSEKPQWRKEYFPMFSEVMQDVDARVVSDLKRWQRKMVLALQKKDLEKVLKLIRFRLGIKKFKQITKNPNAFYKLAYYHVFLKKPVKNNVVLFETFNAKNYSDSPKYIYEYLAKNYGDQYEFVWALNNKDIKLPYKGKKVKRFSFAYAYYLAISKYLVFNVRQPLWYRKREEQVFIETWHGTPLKRLVFDQEEVTAASPKYKQEFYKQRSDWDYLVSANDFSTETLRRCFMYEGEMLDFGYPRNDIMYADNKEEIAKQIRRKLQIPENKKTILYAPTWRDDEYYGKGKYKFTLKLDLELLRKRLGNEYVILLRTHQYIADVLDISGLEGFAYNVSKYDDISELYLISDICITDYSSVFFDYANLKRPILFYTYDIEKYKNQLRGFYIDMNTEVPGPLLYTSEEVVDAIEHIEEIEKQYKERYETFYARFCHLDDGNASRKIVEKVFLHK